MGTHNIDLKIQQKGAEKVDKQLKKIVKGTKEVNSNVAKLAKSNGMASFAKKVAAVATAFVALKAVIGGIKFVFNKFLNSIKAFFKQELALKRLSRLMKNVKGYTKSAYDGIVKLSSAIQKWGVVADDVLQAGASQLSTFQITGENIQKLLPALGDLIVATYGVDSSQEQAIQSANLLGKVFDGSYGALTRVGISLTDAQKQLLKTGDQAQKTATLVEILKNNFGGLNKELRNTGAGIWKALKDVWGDLNEKFGKNFWEKSGIKTMIEKLTAFLSSPLAENWVDSLGTGVGNVVKMVTDYMKKIGLITKDKYSVGIPYYSFKSSGNKAKDKRKLRDDGFLNPYNGKAYPQFNWNKVGGEVNVLGETDFDKLKAKINKLENLLKKEKNNGPSGPFDIGDHRKRIKTIEANIWSAKEYVKENEKNKNFKWTNTDAIIENMKTADYYKEWVKKIEEKEKEVKKERELLNKKILEQGGIKDKNQVKKLNSYKNSLGILSRNKQNLNEKISYLNNTNKKLAEQTKPKSTKEIAKNVWDDITNAIQKGLEWAWKTMKTTYETIAEKISELIAVISGTLVDTLNNLIETIKDLNLIKKIDDVVAGNIMKKHLINPRNDDLIRKDGKLIVPDDKMNPEVIKKLYEKAMDEKQQTKDNLAFMLEGVYEYQKSFNSRLESLESQSQAAMA